MTLAKGHHAQTRGTARIFLIFHTVAVHLNNNGTLLFVTGEGDIARFNSRRYTYTVSVIKLARVQYFMTELCQFLGGDCKVMIAVNQRSQTLLAVRNKVGELIWSKKTPQLKGRGPKKGKKTVF